MRLALFILLLCTCVPAQKALAQHQDITFSAEVDKENYEPEKITQDILEIELPEVLKLYPGVSHRLSGSSQADVCCKFATMLPCVSMAPFATPVVPPVYCKNARSSCVSFG